MSDLIDRAAAIDATWKAPSYTDPLNVLTEVRDRIAALPSAHPEIDEWCTDCKEYDSEKHCCPRFNRVIREALSKRKTGRWMLVKGSNGKDYHKCSECLHTQEITGVKNYCAVCGAKMEVEHDND